MYLQGGQARGISDQGGTAASAAQARGVWAQGGTAAAPEQAQGVWAQGEQQLLQYRPWGRRGDRVTASLYQCFTVFQGYWAHASDNCL